MTLGDIIQEAMYRVDEPVNETTGMWSLAWWTTLVNRAQRHLARRTGYKTARHACAVSAKTQRVALPSTYCWGILGLWDGDTQILPKTEDEMERECAGWRYQSNFPNQPTDDGIHVFSASGADIGQTVTIYGTVHSTGVYTSEVVTLAGASVKTTTQIHWGEVYYILLSAACAGAVTVQEASADAVIATIAIGDLTAGTDITVGDPLYYVLRPPYFEVWPIPETARTLWLVGGALPTAFTAATTLADASTPDALPGEFHDALADGAAVYAAQCDLNERPDDPKALTYWNSYMALAQELKQYLNSMSRDGTPTMNVTAGLGWDNVD